MSFLPVAHGELTRSAVSELRHIKENIVEEDEHEDSDSGKEDKDKDKSKDRKDKDGKDKGPAPVSSAIGGAKANTQPDSKGASGRGDDEDDGGSAPNGLLALLRKKKHLLQQPLEQAGSPLATPTATVSLPGHVSDTLLDAPIDSPVKTRKSSFKGAVAGGGVGGLQCGSSDSNDGRGVRVTAASGSPSTMSVLQSAMRRDSKGKVTPLNDVPVPNESESPTNTERDRRVSFHFNDSSSPSVLQVAPTMKSSPLTLYNPSLTASVTVSSDDKGIDEAFNDDIASLSSPLSSESPSGGRTGFFPADDIEMTAVDEAAIMAKKQGRSVSLGITKSGSIQDMMKTQHNQGDSDDTIVALAESRKRAVSDSSRTLLGTSPAVNASSSAAGHVYPLTTIQSGSSQVGEMLVPPTTNKQKSWV
jgi:hypothetical protein